MPKKNGGEQKPKQVKEEVVLGRPAETVEGREQQLINLAVNLAEKQLRDGTASPSVINHYLKMGSQRENIEREMLATQVRLLEAKTKNFDKENDMDALTKTALEAFRSYQPGS